MKKEILKANQTITLKEPKQIVLITLSCEGENLRAHLNINFNRVLQPSETLTCQETKQLKNIEVKVINIKSEAAH